MTNTVYNDLTTCMNELTSDNWYYVKKSPNHIILAKTYFELDRIDVEFKNNIIHLSLPLKNSPYCFYNKWSYNDTNTVNFFRKYMNDFSS